MSENNTNTENTEAVATAVDTQEVSTPVSAPADTTTTTTTADAAAPVNSGPEASAPVVASEVKVEKTATPGAAVTRPAGSPRPSYSRAGGPAGGAARPGARRPSGAPGARGRNDRGGRRAPMERVKPEFDQKILDIRRVTRVVSGGRRFSFSVAIALGDGKGRVGLGSGKSSDTSLAIEKAVKDARKKMITLKLTKTNSISQDINEKFASSRVFIMPNRGRGLIAGSSARVILSLAGVKDVTAKFHSGSKNKLNNGKVTMKALETVAYKHGEVRIAPKVQMVEETPTETNPVK